MAERLRAGAAETVITPPLGVDLTGFGGRPGPASGVYSDLYARALVLELGGTRLAVVAIDVLGLDFDLVQRTRALIEEATGIAAECVLLNSSHSHSGPAVETLRGLGDRDEAYAGVLCRLVAGTVRTAADRLEDARLAWGSATAAIGMNRRRRLPGGATTIADNPEGPYDANVYVLRVDGADGRPLAVGMCHACHPVILGSGNTFLSAEFPGEAVETVRRCRVGGATGAIPFFLQGCCGDVNPIHRGGWEEVRKTGTMLGAAAALAAESASGVTVDRLEARSVTLELALEDPPPVPEAEAALAAERERAVEMERRHAEGGANRGQLSVARAMVTWAEEVLAWSREGNRPRTVPFEIQVFRLGEAAIVAMAGEVFIRYSDTIRRHSPFAPTLVLGYTNGCIGYVPTEDAYPEGGYEVGTAYRYYDTLMIRSDCERRILAATEDILRGLAA